MAKSKPTKAGDDHDDDVDDLPKKYFALAIKGGPEFAQFCIKQGTSEFDDKVVEKFLEIREKYPTPEMDDDEEYDNLDVEDKFAEIVQRRLLRANLVDPTDARRYHAQLSMAFIHYKVKSPEEKAAFAKLKLSPGGLKLLDRLAKAKLFQTAGQPIKDADVVAAKSWKEALGECQKRAAQEFSTRLFHKLRQSATEIRGDQWNGWNDLIDYFKAEIGKRLGGVIDAQVTKEKLPTTFKNLVTSDVASALLLLEFPNEVCKPWIDRTIELLVAGRFVGGFRGKLAKSTSSAILPLPSKDDGKLVVY